MYIPFVNNENKTHVISLIGQLYFFFFFEFYWLSFSAIYPFPPTPQKCNKLSVFKKKLFIYLNASGLGCGMQTSSCSLWYLVPQPGIKIGSPVLGPWSLSHWTTKEVPVNWILKTRNITSSFTMFTFYVLVGEPQRFSTWAQKTC